MSVAFQVRGTWVRWATSTYNSTWHWVHSDEPNTYCGKRHPTEATEEVAAWNPMYPCRKCLERIGREGY